MRARRTIRGAPWAALLIVGAGACGSSIPAPVETAEASPPSGEGAEASAAAMAYPDPQIDGRPVAQCVTGQGWGAFAPGRCDPAAQRVIADQFCAAQKPSSAAVDWTLQHGPSGRHAIWMYDHGSPPAGGHWSHGITVDRFAEIRCQP